MLRWSFVKSGAGDALTIVLSLLKDHEISAKPTCRENAMKII